VIQPTGVCGVRIAGTGSAVPDRVLTNDDLARIMDTTDEWITQRTGIRCRRVSDPSKEGTFTLARDALRRALEASNMKGSDLDLIVVGTCTAEMRCPSLSCRVAGELGAINAGAFDVVAACSGFVYALNVAETMVRSGRYRNVGVVGADAMSTMVDYQDRSVSILFGDAAGAAVLTPDPDLKRGCIYQTLGSDGRDWSALYIPMRAQEIPEKDRDNPIRLGFLRMDGREVFKFAVNKFREVIVDAFAQTGLTAADVSQIICHQSNARIIENAIEKLGLPREKVLINIDQFGNSSSGSVGLCLDQVWRAGKVPAGKPMMLVAFGGGVTWASSVWNV
jgi:3-oxoacyl-[acyl-carrier-protein] synthase-3